MRRIVIALAAATVMLLTTACGSEARFSEKCIERDGHLYGTGLRLCLTDDGRVIEVYP